MNHDSLHAKITSALGKPLNPAVFQRCATALLRDAYSTLSPLVGGDDAGMDGAVGTSAGAFPVVCTTSADVTGNLKKSLKENCKKRRGPRQVVVATSQQLTNRKKRNLEDAATALGFTLVNIHDRPYFADRLYRDSQWRMELLGISGNPPALSKLPRQFRTPTVGDLIGRDSELEWLGSATSDVLLVGQPGSGKTSLHQRLAIEGKCLFAVDGDQGRLADAIREQRPTVIVVDDTHFELELVEQLHRLRHELGVQFSIHANCWPGYEAQIRTLLNLTDDRLRTLNRLPRQTILEVIHNCGIGGPDELLHFLIQQADGKPGLAVALAEATKRDGTKRLWTGELLADQLARLIRPDPDRSVLAAIAVGGDAGMTLEDIASSLSLSPADVRQIASALGAGGVIESVAGRHMQVRPPHLRAVLVRDAFFSNAFSLGENVLSSLLEKTRSPKCTASVLMSARQIGASVNNDVIERFLLASNDSEIWEHYSWVDEDCARRVIEAFSDHVCEAAPGVLHFRPVDALPRLFNADAENRFHKGAVENPRRRIEEWLTQENDPPGATVERRRQLLDALKDWRLSNSNPNDDLTAAILAATIAPNYDFAKMKPGSGREYVMTFGIFSSFDLKGIFELWPAVREILADLPVSGWNEIPSTVLSWCFPGRHERTKPLPKKVCGILRGGGTKMLSDLAALPAATRAVKQWARHNAKCAGLRVRIDVEPLIRVVFDDPRVENFEIHQKKRGTKLAKLATELAVQPPESLAKELADIEREFAEFKHNHGGWDRGILYQRLAETYDDCVSWLTALVAARIPQPYVEMTMRFAFARDFNRANAMIASLVEDQDYGPAAANLILSSDRFDAAAFERAVRRVSSDHYYLGWLAWTPAPMRTAVALLSSPNQKVRTSVAIAEWTRANGNISYELIGDWRKAILEIEENDHSLPTLLASNRDLAFDWVQRRLHGERGKLWNLADTAKKVAECLSITQRGSLLELFTRENFTTEWFHSLLRGDSDLYRQWLATQPDRYLRLKPLDKPVGQEWIRLAIAALDAGCTPSEVAEHAIPRSVGGFGKLSAHYRSMIPTYEGLAKHSDGRLRLAGQQGLQWAKRGEDQALERERQESIFGL